MRFIKRVVLSLFFILTSLLSHNVAVSETVSTSSIPWSGYWWALSQGGLTTGYGYRGHPAPLEKYDLIVHGRYPGTLSSWYYYNRYDPNAPGWYGHCAAWSKAAIKETYDILPSSEDNVIFRVGDKKGLLTLAHSLDVVEIASGSSPTDFHYWLLSNIKDKDTPFVADLDLSLEKWFYPIYKYDMQTTKLGNVEQVTVTVYYATDNVFPDYMGSKIKTQKYTYELQVDSASNIIGGAWTGESVTNHPDLLVFPLSQQTDAEGLDYSRVKEIVQKQDDFLENGVSSVALPPGNYNLVLLDPDNYTVDMAAGEGFIVTVEKHDGSSATLEAELLDKNSTVVSSGSISEKNGTLQFTVGQSDDGPYQLKIDQADYSDPNIYSIVVNVRKSYLKEISYLPKSQLWSGITMTNDSEAPVEQVMLTTHDALGKPLHTIWGPSSLQPGEKKVMLFESLPYRKHELSQTTGLTLSANSDVELVNLVGSPELLASQIQKVAPSPHIILPETNSVMVSSVFMAASVKNESLDDNNVVLKSYKSDGTFVLTTEQTLAANATLPIEAGQIPFYHLPADGWIDVASNNGQDLSGYVYRKDASSADGLFGLTVNKETKYIAHIPPADQWLTSCTIINPTSEESIVRFHPTLAGTSTTSDVTVTLAPFEKRRIDIGADFSWFPGDPLYRSLIEVDADHEFVGYYTYQRLGGGDKSSVPMFEAIDFKDKLTMPHYPRVTYWWTGMILFNPLSFSQDVLVTAYDNSGLEQQREVTILPGGYEIFTIGALFNRQTDDVSFVTFESETAGGVIGGGYLYGSRSSNSLSGSNM